MKRKHFINLTAGLVLAVFTATGIAGDKMSKKVNDHANSGGNHELSVIVRYAAMPGQSENNRLNGLQAQTERTYGVIKMRTVKVKANKLDDLINDPNVEFVDLNSPVKSFTEAARLTANEPLANNGSPAFNGEGFGVAVIDSGVNAHNDVYEGSIEQYTFLSGASGTPTALARISHSPRPKPDFN